MLKQYDLKKKYRITCSEYEFPDDQLFRIIQIILTHIELYIHTGFTFQEPIWLIQCFTENTISSTIAMYLPY